MKKRGALVTGLFLVVFMINSVIGQVETFHITKTNLNCENDKVHIFLYYGVDNESIDLFYYSHINWDIFSQMCKNETINPINGVFLPQFPYFIYKENNFYYGTVYGQYDCSQNDYDDNYYNCRTYLSLDFYGDNLSNSDNSYNKLRGNIIMYGGYFNSSKNYANLGTNGDGIIFLEYNHNIINNLSQRISTLELWKVTIDSWKSALTTTINTIQILLTGHTTKIEALENKTCSCQANQTANFPNYFKYLSSNDRKDMVCGYAQDNHLTTINDLGWNCTITYKARGNPSCKCKSL